MAIIPSSPVDFDIVEWECSTMLFSSMHFRPPQQGETYWRVPGFIENNEIEILIEKIGKYFANENELEEAIQARIQQRRAQAMDMVIQKSAEEDFITNDNLDDKHTQDKEKAKAFFKHMNKKKKQSIEDPTKLPKNTMKEVGTDEEFIELDIDDDELEGDYIAGDEPEGDDEEADMYEEDQIAKTKSQEHNKEKKRRARLNKKK